MTIFANLQCFVIMASEISPTCAFKNYADIQVLSIVPAWCLLLLPLISQVDTNIQTQNNI